MEEEIPSLQKHLLPWVFYYAKKNSRKLWLLPLFVVKLYWKHAVMAVLTRGRHLCIDDVPVTLVMLSAPIQ